MVGVGFLNIIGGADPPRQQQQIHESHENVGGNREDERIASEAQIIDETVYYKGDITTQSIVQPSDTILLF